MQFVIIAFLLTLGITFWLIGHYFEFTGIAVIGATLVLIAGSAIVLTGLDVRSGMVQTKTYTTVDNSTVVNSTSTDYTYQSRSVGDIFGVGILGSLGIGGLLMIGAAVMMSQSLLQSE